MRGMSKHQENPKTNFKVNGSGGFWEDAKL